MTTHPDLDTPAPYVDANVRVGPAGAKGVGVFAVRAFAPGEVVIVSSRQSVANRRTIHTIQTDWNTHVLIDEPAIRLNHSDTANVGVRDNDRGAYDFIALVPIAPGDEICYDYETTESTLTPEFQRVCPAPEGRTSDGRGFSALTAEARARYGEFIANYLKGSSDPSSEPQS